MKWTPEAKAAVDKVPFFVRKKVRQRVENEAAAQGRKLVTLVEVKATQKRYLAGMAAEVKGYQLDVCFGPNGCPHRASASDELVRNVEGALKSAGLLGFLQGQVGERLKFHHEFRVTVAECPNACSQPQIKDVGIIGAQLPNVTGEPCSECLECRHVCPDAAVSLPDGATGGPIIDTGRCMACGKCIHVCPTDTITAGPKGYKVLLAGKLGRHPKLARPLPDIYNEQEVVDILLACLSFYKDNSRNGRRFSEIFTTDDHEAFARRFAKSHVESR